MKKIAQYFGPTAGVEAFRRIATDNEIALANLREHLRREPTVSDIEAAKEDERKRHPIIVVTGKPGDYVVAHVTTVTLPSAVKVSY